MKCKCGVKLLRYDSYTYICSLCGLKQAVTVAYINSPTNININAVEGISIPIIKPINSQKDIVIQQYTDNIQAQILNAFKIPVNFLEKKGY